MLFFICFFITLCICQYLFFKYYNIDNKNINNKNFSNLINNIKENNEFIDSHLISILKERVDLLENNKLNYKEWIDFNNKNKNIYVNNKESLSINIYENINGTNNFIIRVFDYEEINNQSLNNYITKLNETFYFMKNTIDINFINNMFKTYVKNNQENTLNYNWIDDKNYVSLYKKSFYIRYKSKEGTEGIILISYPIENLSILITKKKVNFIHLIILIIAYLILFIVTFLIFLLNKDKGTLVKIKAYIILITINIYFLYYFNSYDREYKPLFENNILSLFSSNLLSISFLIGGVNIYIISSLSILKNKTLIKESILLFSFSLILLLASVFRLDIGYKETELIKYRISINFLFNFSLIFNIFLIFNYIIYKFNIKL